MITKLLTFFQAIAQCTGRTNAQIKADVASTGDLGIVAEKSRSNQRIMFRPAPLTVQSVFNQLTVIANISGQSVWRNFTKNFENRISDIDISISGNDQES